MNRELTRRETVLLLILVVLVIFLGYFKLIFEPIQDQVAQYQDTTSQEQSELGAGSDPADAEAGDAAQDRGGPGLRRGTDDPSV